MIVLFTDFGLEGPYAGQVKAVLYRQAPGVPVIDLFADAPAHRPREAAYLLAAHAGEFHAGSVFVCVVDPGVGGARLPLVLDIDGRWLVGPDNGLFEPLLRRAARSRCFEILARPERLSASFHGRDLFAPAAAGLARGLSPAALGCRPVAPARRPDWPDDLAAIVYADRWGNMMTGLRAASLAPDARLAFGGRVVPRARTFSDVPPGAPLWYENSCGLAEFAVNQGRADRLLGGALGDEVAILP